MRLTIYYKGKLEIKVNDMQYANQIGYSDVSPFEVVRAVSDKTLEVRAMTAERDPEWQPNFIPGGFSAHCANNYDQRWIITSDETNPVIRIRLSKNNGWQDAGHNRYKLAEAPRKFYDYNF